jgi:hypothetical protein
MTDKKQLMLSEANQVLAKYIGMVIRNAMEDFHCQHLTDEQMRELNPIIRNAIGTAMHAFDNCERSRAARDFVDYAFKSIPNYWEPAEPLEGYVKMWERTG